MLLFKINKGQKHYYLSKIYNLYQKDAKAASPSATTAAEKSAVPKTTAASQPTTPIVTTPATKTTSTPAPAPAKVF